MADLQSIEKKVMDVDGKVGSVTEDLMNITSDLGELSRSLENALGSLQQQVSAVNAITVDPVAGVESTPYTISTGYNLIGYTGVNGIPIEDAFIQASGISDIMDRIALIKDQSGNFYHEDYASLTSLVNGRGYFLQNLGEPFSVNWG